MSAMSIVTALALAGGATFAFFSDTATSSDNTFSTGNADLLIAPEGPESPGSYSDSIAGFIASNLIPGFEDDFVFWLKNGSSADMSFDLVGSFANVSTTGNADIANQLTAQITCMSDTDNNGSLDTTIATSGTFSVNGWAGGPQSLGTLGPNDGDSDGTGPDEAECTMHVVLPDGLNSTYENSSAEFDGVFDATQVDPTP